MNKDKNQQFDIDQIVFARLSGNRYWPATIKGFASNNMPFVEFIEQYGDYNGVRLNKEVLNYEQGQIKIAKSVQKGLQKAIQTAQKLHNDQLKMSKKRKNQDIKLQTERSPPRKQNQKKIKQEEMSECFGSNQKINTRNQSQQESQEENSIPQKKSTRSKTKTVEEQRLELLNQINENLIKNKQIKQQSQQDDINNMKYENSFDNQIQTQKIKKTRVTKNKSKQNVTPCKQNDNLKEKKVTPNKQKSTDNNKKRKNPEDKEKKSQIQKPKKEDKKTKKYNSKKQKQTNDILNIQSNLDNSNNNDLNKSNTYSQIGNDISDITQDYRNDDDISHSNIDKIQEIYKDFENQKLQEEISKLKTLQSKYEQCIQLQNQIQDSQQFTQQERFPQSQQKIVFSQEKKNQKISPQFGHSQLVSQIQSPAKITDPSIYDNNKNLFQYQTQNQLPQNLYLQQQQQQEESNSKNFNSDKTNYIHSNFNNLNNSNKVINSFNNQNNTANQYLLQTPSNNSNNNKNLNNSTNQKEEKQQEYIASRLENRIIPILEYIYDNPEIEHDDDYQIETVKLIKEYRKSNYKGDFIIQNEYMRIFEELYDLFLTIQNKQKKGCQHILNLIQKTIQENKNKVCQFYSDYSTLCNKPKYEFNREQQQQLYVPNHLKNPIKIEQEDEYDLEKDKENNYILLNKSNSSQSNKLNLKGSTNSFQLVGKTTPTNTNIKFSPRIVQNNMNNDDKNKNNNENMRQSFNFNLSNNINNLPQNNSASNSVIQLNNNNSNNLLPQDILNQGFIDRKVDISDIKQEELSQLQQQQIKQDVQTKLRF